MDIGFVKPLAGSGAQILTKITEATAIVLCTEVGLRILEKIGQAFSQWQKSAGGSPSGSKLSELFRFLGPGNMLRRAGLRVAHKIKREDLLKETGIALIAAFASRYLMKRFAPAPINYHACLLQLTQR